MSRIARSACYGRVRAVRFRTVGRGLASAAVLLASLPAHAQAPGAPSLMRYDLKVGEGTSGLSMRVVGSVAMHGREVLMRHCLQPHPFAPMLCQLTVNGQSSPPIPMPPEPPGMSVLPGPWGAVPGGGLASPARALDQLFTPPPGVPGWQMQARGSGSWMGYAAEGSFSYWQPLY